MSNDKPLVSVCMITYNHEAFIAQAIEGVLMQQTDFPIELVIGEDCSTDNTRSICEDYRSRHPHVIRLLPRHENVGMMRNFVETLDECEGTYIAYCEGDDYWTDANKLQKQAQFLESNVDYSSSFHDVQVYDQSSQRFDGLWCKRSADFLTFTDLAREGCIIPTGTFMFRNVRMELPDWTAKAALGDLILFLLAARNGNIKFHPDVMGVYRRHDGGVWSSNRWKENLPGYAATLERCCRHFAPLGRQEFQQQLKRLEADLCFIAFEDRDFNTFRERYKRLHLISGRLSMRTRLALVARRLKLSFFVLKSLYLW